jgi:signal transduction histidine kinase
MTFLSHMSARGWCVLSRWEAICAQSIPGSRRGTGRRPVRLRSQCPGTTFARCLAVETEPVTQALRDARRTLTAALADESRRSPRTIELALEAVDRAERALEVAASASQMAIESPQALEQRLHELTRTLAQHDEFLSTLGHELRNPLSPIYMQARYLLDAVRQGQPKALTREWLVPQLEAFCARLQKFLEMLNRLMDVSRMSAGRLSLELEELDLVTLVREVSQSFERELAAARSELRIDAPPQAKGVWDRLRVEQIFTNLLSNAIRYGAGKPIDVKIGGDDEQVELTVTDQGVGIDADDQQRIFQRFERAGKTRSAGGFGIGLWTVRQCCLAMGGHVSVKSQPGSGSEFTAVLPRVTEESHS